MKLYIRLYNQLVGIHNPAAKQLILHQHLEIAGSGDRASLVPPQRRCRVCTWYILTGSALSKG